MKYLQTLSLLAFCFLSLFLYFQSTGTRAHQDIDSKAYLERGYLFYTTNRFVTDQNPAQPYYTLGYPFIIGVLYKLFGPSTAVIIFFQLLLALLSCLLMMRIATYLYGPRAGSIAVIFFTMSIGYYTFTQFVLTELLLSFFLLCFFYLFLNKKYYQSALILGLSILIKPAAILFTIPMIFYFLLFSSHKIKTISTFLLAFMLPVLGYMTYNKVTFDHFGISKLDQVNLYYWYFPNVLAKENGTTADIERTKLLNLSDGHHNFDVVAPLFWRKLQHKPWLFIKVWMTGVFKTLAGLYTTNLKVLVEPNVQGGDISFFKASTLRQAQGARLSNKGRHGEPVEPPFLSWLQLAWNYITAGVTKPWVMWVGLFEAMWSIIRYILVALGLCALLRRRQWAVLIFCLLFLAYFTMITGHDGCARFRMMIEFLLIVLAAGGFTDCFLKPLWRVGHLS